MVDWIQDLLHDPKAFSLKPLGAKVFKTYVKAAAVGCCAISALSPMIAYKSSIIGLIIRPIMGLPSALLRLSVEMTHKSGRLTMCLSLSARLFDFCVRRIANFKSSFWAPCKERPTGVRDLCSCRVGQTLLLVFLFGRSPLTTQRKEQGAVTMWLAEINMVMLAYPLAYRSDP